MWASFWDQKLTSFRPISAPMTCALRGISLEGFCSVCRFRLAALAFRLRGVRSLAL